MPPKEEEVPVFMQGKSKLELKAEKAAAKAARKAAKENRPSGGGKDSSGGGAAGENGALPHSMSALSLASSNPANPADTTYSMRTVTGVLASRPAARDIKISGFSLGLNGIELIKECSIELTIGRRYGLIGQNGSGKTNFLQCIANREVGAALCCVGVVVLVLWCRTTKPNNQPLPNQTNQPSPNQPSLNQQPSKPVTNRSPSPSTWTSSTCTRRPSRRTCPPSRPSSTTSKRSSPTYKSRRR
jgi:hypothetical protein